MATNIGKVLTFIFLVVKLSNCKVTQPNSQNNTEESKNVTAEINKLNEKFYLEEYGKLELAVARFTQGFYLHMVEHSENPNFVFSPLSLHSALSLLYLGTTQDSDTQKEMEKVMGEVFSPPIIKESYKNIVDSYAKQVSFLYGNRIWVSEDFKIKENYTKTVKENFKAEVTPGVFSDPAQVTEVNDWVSKLTNNKIKQLVDQFSPATKLFLANALFFSEKWKYPFIDVGPLGNILNGTFNTGNGIKDVNFIQQVSEELIYGDLSFKGNKMEVVTVPYKNPDFEMQIILPAKNHGIEKLEGEMKLQEDRDLISNIRDAEYINIFSAPKDQTDEDIIDVRLTMPTFQVESKFDAGEAIQSLGARKIFTERAELAELSDEGPLGVSSIVHNAVIEVSKEGTEGAAATGIELVLFSAGFGVNKNVLVNRPFIFVVQDKVNNIPVLVGRVKDPTLITRSPK